MALRQSRTPSHLQANQDKVNVGLQTLGLQPDPGAMQGGDRPTDDQDGLPLNPEPGTLETVATVDPFKKLGDGPDDLETPEDLSASQDDGLGTGEEGELHGPAKREADARAAQREMSKTQVKLDKTVKQIETMMSDLGDRQGRLEETIQRLSTMRAATGEVPADITPASDEVMEVWKQDYGEALSVIDARVAPLYAEVSKFGARIDELAGMLERIRLTSKTQEIETEVYSKIPKATLKRVVESDAFVTWFKDQSPEYQVVIRNAVEKTTTVHPKTTLKVFRDFSADTGIQIPNLSVRPTQQVDPDPMDTTPQLRGGVQLNRQRQLQPPANPQANTPLSAAELMNLKNALATGTESEKAILRQRLSLTQINVNGDAASMDLKG